MTDLPDFVSHIWAVGNEIHISFPPLPGNTKSHSIILPNSPSGLMALGTIIKDRARLGLKSTIATKGSPVQYDIEGMLKAMKETKKKASADLSIADLGLAESSLDLSMLEDL